MKKYIFLYSSTEEPDMAKKQLWMDWFQSVGDKFVDAGNPLLPGVHVTEKGTHQIAQKSDTTSGYSIISAENIDEAEKIALGCPNQNIRIYEALPM